MANAKCDNCLASKHLSSKRSADFLCIDCEKYLCSSCYYPVFSFQRGCIGHLTFAVKDKSNKTKLDQFSAEIMRHLTSEIDQTLERFTKERTHLCDVVDLECDDKREVIMDICILNGNKKWAITNWANKCINVFNINNNKMTRTIHLAYKPCGITEIPSTDPSKSLIAVSFPYARQIETMNINSDPARVISSINIQGTCRDLAYCNNKLITRCVDDLDGEWRHSIHVLNMTGEIINVIDLHNLPGTQRKWRYLGYMCVHSESETIYVCHYDDPPRVFSLSLDGQVLHYVKFTDLKTCLICVDRDHTVYVMGDKSPLYKLSSDLSQKEKFIDMDLLYRWFTYSYTVTSIACHADTFYIVRSDGRVCIIRHE